MKQLFENWRKFVNEGRRRKIETLEDFDLSPPSAKKLADDKFIRLSTYIHNNRARFGEKQIKDFEARIFEIFFKGKRLYGKYPITGFKFDQGAGIEKEKWWNRYDRYDRGYLLFVDGAPWYAAAFPDRKSTEDSYVGQYLDFDKDLT